LLGHVGATLESLSGTRMRVHLGRAKSILQRPHHRNVLDSSALLHLRQSLPRGRVTPSQYEHRVAEAGRPVRRCARRGAGMMSRRKIVIPLEPLP